MIVNNSIKSRLINHPVVIDDWHQDDTYDGVFPKGARDKSVYFSPKIPEESAIRADHRYLFKLSRNWCPWQFWMEVIAYRLGLLIGVEVPPAHIGYSDTYNPGQNTYGALIEWFFDDQNDTYVEGGQIMMGLVEGYDRDKGTQHNFGSIRSVLSKFPNFIEHWAGVFTLDSLIGNTDRHQDNWGLVVINGKIKSEKLELYFSPAFDNGTALGYEILEEKIDNYKDPTRLQRYLAHPQKARHHMKWSLEQQTPYNFYEFLQQFVLEFPQAVPIITQRHVAFTQSQLSELLEPLLNAVSEPLYALTRNRLEFVIRMIMQRKALVEKILGR